MPKHPPADELAETLAELARLRLRAGFLRAQMVKNPDLGANGRHARAVVTLQRDRVFDPALLPPKIRDDPHYHRDHHHWTVHCQKVPRDTAPRPGWPIRRDAMTALH